MEIRVLRYFLAVAREESISRAAERLHITQPTLSRQLAQLESEVGTKLFERGTRKILLTHEGILLRRRAEEIVCLVDKTQRELAEQEERIDGRIVFGCGELAAVEILSGLLETFSREYPLVTYDLYTANADLVKERMDQGLVDIGLLMEPISVENYEFIRLKEKEKWVVLMRPEDPLSRKEAVTAEDLAQRPLILPRRSNVRNELASWFGDHYENLRILFTSNFCTNGAVMVQRGLGYELTVEGAMPFWDEKKIAARPLRPELTAASVLAWKRHRPFGPAVSKFIEHARCSLSMGFEKK